MIKQVRFAVPIAILVFLCSCSNRNSKELSENIWILQFKISRQKQKLDYFKLYNCPANELLSFQIQGNKQKGYNLAGKNWHEISGDVIISKNTIQYADANRNEMGVLNPPSCFYPITELLILFKSMLSQSSYYAIRTDTLMIYNTEDTLIFISESLY